MGDLFTQPDTWTGGSIELLLWFADPAAAVPALEAAWKWPALHGPYVSNREDPSTQRRADVRVLGVEQLSTLYGVATLPNRSVAAFASRLIQEQDGFGVYLGVPLGSLGRAYPVGAFPFEGTPLDPWAQEIYSWLSDLARFIFSDVRFSAGIIGWLTVADYDDARTQTIPARRFHGYVRVSNGEVNYLPPNVGEPLMQV